MLGERCSALLQRAGSSGDNLTLLAARLAAAEKERDAARWGGLLQSVPMRLLTVCLCLSCVCVCGSGRWWRSRGSGPLTSSTWQRPPGEPPGWLAVFCLYVLCRDCDCDWLYVCMCVQSAGGHEGHAAAETQPARAGAGAGAAVRHGRRRLA